MVNACPLVLTIYNYWGPVRKVYDELENGRRTGREFETPAKRLTGEEMLVELLQLGMGFGEASALVRAAEAMALRQAAKDCITGGMLLTKEGLELIGKGVERRAVMLGEGMDAIKTAVRKLREEGVDAKWYQAWGKNFKPENFDLEKSLLRNERWLKSKIDADFDFYDIGIDPTRARRSAFYELEQKILRENNITPTPLKRP